MYIIRQSYNPIPECLKDLDGTLNMLRKPIHTPWERISAVIPRGCTHNLILHSDIHLVLFPAFVLIPDFKNSAQVFVIAVIECRHDVREFVIVPSVVFLVEGEEGGEYGWEDDGVQPGRICLVLVAVVVGYDALSLLVAFGPHEHAQLCPGLAQQKVFISGDDVWAVFPAAGDKVKFV